MREVTFPEVRPAGAIPAILAPLWLVQALLIAVLVAIVCCAAINATKENRCKGVFGRLTVQLKLDSYFSNCRCVKPSLDFRDACNSGYIAII
jgi:hypothetical protein